MSKYIKIDDLQAFCDNQIDHNITPNDFQRMNCIEIVKCEDCKHGRIYDGVHEKLVACEFEEFSKSLDFFCANGVNKNE